MAEIFERAWGNYTALMNFLLQADPNTQETTYGIFQPFDLATLFSYSKGKNNYNNFLLDNLSNFVAPTKLLNDAQADKIYEYPIKLEDAYRNFLNEFNDFLLSNLDPSKKPDINKLNQDLQSAQTTLSNFETTLNDKWRVYVGENKIPDNRLEDERIIWERESGYSLQLDRYKNDVRSANVRINAFIKKNTSRDLWPLLDAVAYFDDPNYMVKLPPNPQFDDVTRQSYWRSFRWQFPIIDMDEFLTNDAPVTNTFDTVAQDYSRVETKWNVKVSWGWGLFSGGGNVERRTCEELSTNSEFSFQISFKRFQNIEIFRDKWYQDVLFTTIGKQFEAYWGPNGLLGAIPYSIVIARGTTIKVKMSDDYKKAFESFISSGGSFGFGPFFSAGGGYSKDEKYMNYRKTDEGFELTDSDQTVRVIGACVKRFNWNDNKAKDYHEGVTLEKLIAANNSLYALLEE